MWHNWPYYSLWWMKKLQEFWLDSEVSWILGTLVNIFLKSFSFSLLSYIFWQLFENKECLTNSAGSYGVVILHNRGATHKPIQNSYEFGIYPMSLVFTFTCYFQLWLELVSEILNLANRILQNSVVCTLDSFSTCDVERAPLFHPLACVVVVVILEVHWVAL